MSISSTSQVDHIFLQQAEYICRGSEYLPGGPEALAKKLQHSANEQRPLRVKLGLDPTRPDLHLGHSVVLRKLKHFQELGHQAVLIIGDATALVGDPSGRSQTRPPLSEEEIKINAETYLAQAGKVIDVPKTEIVRNSEWLSPMGMADILKLMAKMTVAQMLVREDFANRYESNQPIALHEFLYPLMQAYDSVIVKADIELGGTDQRFNTLLGREIQVAYGLETEPQSVLLMPLLEGTDGKIKMSKSYPDHCVNLTDQPSDMFGKLMSIPDNMIIRYMELITTATQDVVQRTKLQLETGSVNPRNVKAEMARWVIGHYYSLDDAAAAEEAFNRQFRDNEIPDDITEVHVSSEEHFHLPTFMVTHQMAPSKSEARRLIMGGGVKINGQKIDDVDYEFAGKATQSSIVQVGKRRFLKVTFS